MAGLRFTVLLASLADSRRSLIGSVLAALAGVIVVPPLEAKKKRKRKKKCKGNKKKCGKTCIPKADCCTTADCEPLLLCAQGTCVIGQGTCLAGLDGCQTSSSVCGQNGEVACSCFQSTVGETRCAAGQLLPNSACGECINDPDCHQRYPP